MDRYLPAACSRTWSICLLLFYLISCHTTKTTNEWLNSVRDDRELSLGRVRRASPAGPIDCKLKAWSSWSECSPCRKKAFRFQQLERPSQFGGTKCVHNQLDQRLCPLGQPCIPENVCGDAMFNCSDSGRCISKHLLCNGDRDCELGSDEDGCDFEREDKCQWLFSIPGARRATEGYNAVIDDFRLPVLDPEYYGGSCEYVYNGEWRQLIYDSYCENLYYNDDEKYYRKPFNFLYYRFMAQASSDGTTESFEDAASFLKARKTENSFNVGVTFGIYYVEAGVSASAESMFLSNISSYNSKELGFVRLVSKIQTAQFKMKSKDLMLHDDFYQSLMELPETYDFGPYARFFSTFGTHFVTQGTMGGHLEYVLVVNKKKMQQSETSGWQLGGCLGASLGLSVSDAQLSAKVTAKVKGCKKFGDMHREEDGSSSLIEDKVVFAKGGLPDGGSAALLFKDADGYRKWGKSLKYFPDLIDYETLPIYELVRMSTASKVAQTRLPHLKMAWERYMLELNSCRCAPCLHNGVPVLSQTACSCVCKSSSSGLACEESNRNEPTHGAWSCWTEWTCQSGQKTRTRQCNNPAPKDGGDPCLGSSTHTQLC